MLLPDGRSAALAISAGPTDSAWRLSATTATTIRSVASAAYGRCVATTSDVPSTAAAARTTGILATASTFGWHAVWISS